MKIIVLVKQVPETAAVKMDEKTGTVIRKDSDAIVNPLDLYAVEAALLLKERCGAEITAVSMGPPAALSALKEVLSMGIDHAVLVSDRAFGGSDTWATSFILSEAIKKAVPDFDLIICGERATDGDTGQVGPETASALNIPTAAYVSEITRCENGEIEVSYMTEGAVERVSMPMPAMITVVKSIGSPRLPTLDGKIRARKSPITTFSQAELNLPATQIGLNGSPTRVVKIFRPKLTRQCTLKTVSDENSLSDAVNSLAEFMHEREVFQ